MRLFAAASASASGSSAKARTAASRAALHAKYGSQGGLAQANHRTFSNVVQRVPQTHCGSCLTLSGRCWTDRCDQNQFAVRAVGQSVNKV